MGSHPINEGSSSISTPRLQLRVFIVSSPDVPSEERDAASAAVRSLQQTPVLFEPAMDASSDEDLYRSHLEHADVFVGIYGNGDASVGGVDLMAIGDEQTRSNMPRLFYVKEPSPARRPAVTAFLADIRRRGDVTYRSFSDPGDLAALIADDLAVLITGDLSDGDPTSSASVLTFLFADLEGSTAMLRRLDGEYPVLLGEYHRIVNRVVQSHRGHVANTEGDGFFCVFNSPVDAVGAAAEIQVAMSSSSWPAAVTPRCRIGIHTGAAVRTAEGYVGLDVHVAARIGAAAQGGQILVSSSVSDSISGEASEYGWALVDLGRYGLKGVGRSERLLRVDMPGLEVVSTAPRARPDTPSTVPATPKRLIGRLSDVNGASEMLMRDSVRLVTLTGTGGTGKTRLAIEMARSLDTRFPDGIVFVDLSAVRDVDRFLPVVGRAIGVRESGGRTIVSGLQAVVDDACMLVVLDNMEQLIGAAPQVAQLIEALPNVKFLATSRTPLRIGWENEYPVPPLEIPANTDGEEQIDRSGAVALFAERAMAARPLFELNEVTRPVVVDITRRLDGLPLAIELAAARLRVFSVEELLRRLDESLDVLERGSSDLPERHRTLRGAIRWSYDLLEPAERIVFRRLGVFSGGWTLQAAVSVCADADHGESVVLDALEELVAKSLVVFTIDESGRPRYRLLETLREFAIEESRTHGEETEIRLRHLAWVREMAGRVQDILPTPEFPPFLDEVERERFNIREALDWSVRNRMGTDDALMVCGMLPLFWDTRGFVAEGLRWSRALVALTTGEGNTQPRGMAHTALGWLEMLADEPDESEWALSSAVQMFSELGDRAWLGRALSMRGMTTYNRGLLDEAEMQFNEAIELSRENDLDWLADAWCTYGLAHVELSRGDFVSAEPKLRHVLDFSRAHGLTWGVGHAQLSLGVLSFMTGNTDESIERIIESLTVRQELRDARGLCDCLGMMALHASVRGDHGLSAVLIGAAEVAREASGDHLVPWQRPLIEQATLSARNALGSSYEERVDEGRDLSMDEAIALIHRSFANSGSEVSATA
ncbi:MAG: adenylate/guanylate cyclase domain-containing protein [Acidimicrobiia bacterium]